MDAVLGRHTHAEGKRFSEFLFDFDQDGTSCWFSNKPMYLYLPQPPSTAGVHSNFQLQVVKRGTGLVQNHTMIYYVWMVGNLRNSCFRIETIAPEEMLYNSVLTSLRRHWTLTWKGQGMSHLMDLIYPQAGILTWFFMCVNLCPCESQWFWLMSSSFVGTQSLRCPETTIQTDQAQEGSEISSRFDSCLQAAEPPPLIELIFFF